MLAFIAPVLIFIAFLLLLLVTLSVPIIKTIYLFTLFASGSTSILNSSLSASVRFGVWGYCTSGVDLSFAGINRDTTAECSRPHLGYTFDDTVANALHVNSFTNVIEKASTAVLVLHPIACGLTFLAFVVSLFILPGRNGTSRFPSLLTLVVGFTAALVTTIIFLVDVILPAVVRHRIQEDTDNAVHLSYGNAPWMILGAALALWFALVGACAGVCACGSRAKRNKY